VHAPRQIQIDLQRVIGIGSAHKRLRLDSEQLTQAAAATDTNCCGRCPTLPPAQTRWDSPSSAQSPSAGTKEGISQLASLPLAAPLPAKCRKDPCLISELFDYSHFAKWFSAQGGTAQSRPFLCHLLSLQRGVSEIEVRDTIHAHTSTSAFVNRSQRDQDAYIDRTVRKALKQNGFSLPIQPSLHSAELCR